MGERMGSVVAFPLMRCADGGTIHVWAHDDGYFEIAHESRSGSSWGSFEIFKTVAAAVSGAHHLNRVQYDGRAEVFLSTGVLAALHPPTSSPVCDRGEF
jgi:hypothetical protein